MTNAPGQGKVIVHAIYEAEEPTKVDSDKLFEKFLRQIERDALAGTFDEFNASIFPNKEAHTAFEERSGNAARCFDERDEEGAKSGKLRFRLELSRDLFSDPAYGLQRLIHTLASDLFERRIPQLRGKARVTDIDLSSLTGVYEDVYRRGGHTVSQIKSAFRLRPTQPLLAFSMKPRACLSDEDYLQIARQAFQGGCQIVELDTRDLILDGEDRLNLLRQLSHEALAFSSSRICRFSANLSGPAHVVKKMVEELSVTHALRDETGPWVVKIDGNLDGLSTIQAIRSNYFSLYNQPIITCYPVLKYALRPALGRNSFIKMLSMSGADIIYPGQSPQFHADARGIDTERVGAAQRHYRSMSLGDYPMLSVAGGVFINSVHAYLSVLGPDIAFFVGGGIALSRKGIKKAAENFAEAIRLSEQDLFENVRIKNLEDKFVELARIYFEEAAPAEYDFVPPQLLKNLPERTKSTNLE